MRTHCCVAVLAGSLMTSAALAQTQNQQQAQSDSGAAASACQQLMNAIREQPLDERATSLRQARQYRNEGNEQACQSALDRTQQASGGQRAGQARNQKADIVVRQRQPQVTVRPAQPTIFVRQPRPTITVEIPPPRITVRTAEPDINVIGTDGRTDADAQIVSKGQPRVHYESAEPRLIVRRGQQQAQVQYQRAGRNEAARQQQGTSGRSTDRVEGANSSMRQQSEADQPTQRRSGFQQRQVQVSDLTDADVLDSQMQQVGTVDRVIQDGNRYFAVVALDEGQQKIRIALNRVYLDDDQLVVRNMSEDQLRQRPGFDDQASAFDQVEDNRTVMLTVAAGSNAQRGAQQGLQQQVGQREDQSRQQAAGRQQGGSQQQQATAQAGEEQDATRNIAAGTLLEMSLYNARGNLLGDVEHVVRDSAGDYFLVIGHGGFLGLGEKQVTVPAERVWRQGDRLQVRGLTDDQIRTMPEWQEGEMTELTDSDRVAIGTSGS